MIDTLVTTGIATAASAISSGATFFFTRRKYNAEAHGTEIENVQKTLQTYIDIVEDNKKRIDMYQSELERCDKEIFALRTENRDLRNQLQNLSLQIIKQKPNTNKK